MANEIKNQEIEKWALDVTRKVNKENDLENVYFSSQKKLLLLKQKMRPQKTPNK